MREKKEKGITLIALVITIVVILILVSVAVTKVIEENGVLTQAEKAGIYTDVARSRGRCKFHIFRYFIKK